MNGDTIIPYLQPLPFKGTGYHRFIFVLYKQTSKLDLKEYRLPESDNLLSRSFDNYEFYKRYQDIITPVGISFFQTKYDDSVRDVFHNKFRESCGQNDDIFDYFYLQVILIFYFHFIYRNEAAYI